MINVREAMPKTVPELIDAFGGATAFGRVIGRNPSTASEMKRRSSIPVEHWPRIVSVAPEHDIALSYDELVNMHVTNSGAFTGNSQSVAGEHAA